MIHEVGIEIRAKLAARGCPFPVVDGPERTKVAGWANERIVLEHDDGGDTFDSPHGQRANPKHAYTRKIGAKITIFAQETRTGAQAFEHRRRAEHALDMVLVALRESLLARRNGLVIKGGKFVLPEDSNNNESPSGAAYELKLTFDRAVSVATWAGAVQPETTMVRLLMTGSPNLTFAAAGFTVTRSSGSWLADGFAVGMAVRIAGTASNNTTAPITALSATVMSFAGGVVNEGPIGGCSVSAGGIRSTTKATAAGGVVDGLTVPGGAMTSCGP